MIYSVTVAIVSKTHHTSIKLFVRKTMQGPLRGS